MRSLDDIPQEEWAFEWDEAKRRSKLEKHGIDFPRATEALKGPRLDAPGSDKNTRDLSRHIASDRGGLYDARRDLQDHFSQSGTRQ